MKMKLILFSTLLLSAIGCKKSVERRFSMSDTYQRIYAARYSIWPLMSLDSQNHDLIYRVYPNYPYSSLDSGNYRHSFVDSIARNLKKYGFCNGGKVISYDDWYQVNIYIEIWLWTLFPTTYEYRYYYPINDEAFRN